MKSNADAVAQTARAIEEFDKVMAILEGLDQNEMSEGRASVMREAIFRASVDASNPRIIRRDQVHTSPALAIYGDLKPADRGVIALSFEVRFGNKEKLIGMSKMDEMLGFVMEETLDLQKCGPGVWPEWITQQHIDAMSVIRSSGGDVFIVGAPILTEDERIAIARHVNEVSKGYWEEFCKTNENRKAAKTAAVLTHADQIRRIGQGGDPNSFMQPRNGLGFYPSKFCEVSVAFGSLPDYQALSVGQTLAQTHFAHFVSTFDTYMNLPSCTKPSPDGSNIVARPRERKLPSPAETSA